MNIVIIYPQLLNTGENFEKIKNITDFAEKRHGVSFKLDDGTYMFLSYHNIIGFCLMEEDKNDT